MQQAVIDSATLTLLVLAVSVLPYKLLELWEKKSLKSWKIIAEGVYDHSVYDIRSFSMAPITKRVIIETTKIYFKDGTFTIVGGKHPSLPEGTQIKVSKNKMAQYKIETA